MGGVRPGNPPQERLGPRAGETRRDATEPVADEASAKGAKLTTE